MYCDGDEPRRYGDPLDYPEQSINSDINYTDVDQRQCDVKVTTTQCLRYQFTEAIEKKEVNLFFKNAIKDLLNDMMRSMMDEYMIDRVDARETLGFMKKLRKKRIVKFYIGEDNLTICGASSNPFGLLPFF